MWDGSGRRGESTGLRGVTIECIAAEQAIMPATGPPSFMPRQVRSLTSHSRCLS